MQYQPRLDPTTLPARSPQLALCLATLLTGLLTPQLTEAACAGGNYPSPMCDGRPDLLVCEVTQCPSTIPAPVIESGILKPKFLILSLLYAAPGSKNCEKPSQVVYESQSTLGTTVSASETVKDKYKVTASAGVSVAGVGASASVHFENEEESTDSSELSIKLTTTNGLSGTQSCKDGIDHDADTFYILLNPQFAATFIDGDMTWEPVPGTMNDIQPVTVAQLKGTAPLTPGMQSALDAYGYNSLDLATILSTSPFATDPNAAPDPSRFQWVGVVPYVQSTTPDYVPGMTTISLTQDQTNTLEHSAQSSYTVGASVEGSAGFAGVCKASFKSEASMTLTNKQTSSATTGQNSTATLAMGVPSSEYAGSSRIGVYFDVIYRTFAFFPIEGQL